MTMNEILFMRIVITIGALGAMSALCSFLLWLFSDYGNKKNKAIEKARDACETFTSMCGIAEIALFCWSVIFTIWRN
jgi:magnesium-transporting ATPase (P-type)